MAYKKTYSKTNWENTPSQSTPISAYNLNKIESGLVTMDERTVELSEEVDRLKLLLVDGNEVEY
jgi:hypothetical protein